MKIKIPSMGLKKNDLVLRSIFFIFLFLITCFSQSAVFNGQFNGEDEPLQWVATTGIINAVLHGNIIEIARLVAIQDQPPLRFFLSVPGVWIWPHSEFGLRFVAIIFSFVMTYLIYYLGKEIGGEMVGVWSALFIAASGVYNWTSMAFGWSVTVVCMILVISQLLSGTLSLEPLDGKKRSFLVNILIIIMFLINTGNILFFVTFILISLFENRNSIKLWLLHMSLAILFYLLYYFLFFGIVSLLSPTGQPIGQLAHNLGRSAGIFHGLRPFIDNLKGINAYFLPFVSWIILGLSVWTLLRKYRIISMWFSLYILVWSFIISGQTAQYFLLFFIVALPFGLKAIAEYVKPEVMHWGCVGVLLAILMWNHTLFIQRYGSNDPGYPTKWLGIGFAEITRQHNIFEPYTTISSDLAPFVVRGTYFVSDLSGSFSTFYYRNNPITPGSANFAGFLGSQDFPVIYDENESCYKPGWITASPILLVSKRIYCSEIVKLIQNYPHSNIRLYLYKIPIYGINLEK